MEDRVDPTKDKTEIMDQFLHVLKEDLLYWDYKNEQRDNEGI